MSKIYSREKEMYECLVEMVSDYIDFIKGNEFAHCEYEKLNKVPESTEELMDAIATIIATAKALNQIAEQSPTSLYVADAQGKTLRINRCFEELSGIKRKDLLGRKTAELEKEAVYQPSAIRLTLKEKRRIAVQQTNVTNRGFYVTGAPIFDENGEIIMAVTNGILNEEIKRVGKYISAKESGEYYVPRKMEIIANNSTMVNILQLANLVKDTSSTIIIEGESGVGKNVIARHIHETSNRSGKRMIEVNCGAIPEALLESELFGYDSGAFTGAKKDGKPGLIELCEGGTILLDEIGEMPMSIQVKLLHFLQNKKIMRVGGTEEISADVRVIAATNKSLEDMVKEGTFREDLYYRLNVVPIVIPPLRERKEDLIPIAQLFVDKFTKLYAREFTLKQEYVDYIMDNPWRGNIRELENYIERLVVTEGNMEIMNRLKETVHAEIPKPKNSLEEMEREAVIEAYRKYGSSYKVAEALDMSQSTAYRKIKKYVKDC